MSRHCYKLVLRAKGIKPIPRDAGKLRSSVLLRAETICATTAALAERRCHRVAEIRKLITNPAISIDVKINSDTPLTGGDNQA